jgi:3-oxoacyl-[acyl-carrier-protein] synthase-1
MGIVSAIGNDVSETLLSLCERRSGIAALRYLQTAHTEFPVGEVKLSNEEMIDLLQKTDGRGKKNFTSATPTTRTSLMGMLAVREALSRLRITNRKLRNLRVALISGTTVGGMDKSERFYLDFLDNDRRNDYISVHDCGACTEMIADYFGIFSQVDTVSTACSSAANAILSGAELLKSGRADIVVAGGTECITKFHLNGFNALMILDRQPCRPFDATRAGLNLGEGAAYIVMEHEGRGAPHTSPAQPLAELSGYANTCDAFHQTASSPDGEGAYLAMKRALENADLQPADIGYINAHGTGTGNNDLSEGRAIERLFDGAIPPVSSTKSFTGHTTSAAGAVEAVISILALQNGFLPANLNFSEKMQELSFVPTAGARVFAPLQHILSNSFGFGGNDTSLIFSKL